MQRWVQGDRLLMPVCHVYHNINQNIAAGAGAGPAGDHTILLNSELFDRFGLHSVAANTERISIKESGVYLVGCQLRIVGGAAGVWCWIRIWRWDASAAAYAPALGTTFEEGVFNNAGNWAPSPFCLHWADPGDWFELGVRHGNVGAVTVQTARDYSPEFFVYQVTERQV